MGSAPGPRFGPGSWSATELLAWEGARKRIHAASQETWPRGRSFFGAKTPDGAHVPTRVPIVIPVFLFVIGGAASSVSGADRRLAGTVVDQSGRAVPRAYVRVLDASGGGERGAFADEAGRFELTATDAAECRVEATLTGFQPAIVPCSSAASG